MVGLKQNNKGGKMINQEMRDKIYALIEYIQAQKQSDFLGSHLRAYLESKDCMVERFSQQGIWKGTVQEVFKAHAEKREPREVYYIDDSVDLLYQYLIGIDSSKEDAIEDEKEFIAIIEKLVYETPIDKVVNYLKCFADNKPFEVLLEFDGMDNETIFNMAPERFSFKQHYKFYYRLQEYVDRLDYISLDQRASEDYFRNVRDKINTDWIRYFDENFDT